MKRYVVFVLALIFASLATGCGDAADPELNGRPLSEWTNDLDGNNLRRHMTAVEGLVQAGPEAAPYLLATIEDSNPSDDDIRVGCAHALLKIDEQHYLPTILRMLEGDDPRLATNLSTAMIRANVQPGRAVAALIPVLHGDDLRLYNYGIRALSDLGPQSADAASVLGRMARGDANPDVRWRSAYALVRLGPAGKAAAPDLLAALADEDPRVREGAAYALGAIAAAEPEVVASLEAATRDSVATVRQRAAKSLEKLRS